MHPKELSINEFSYELPHHRIAEYPLEERDESRLLIFRNRNISEDTYKNISQHIPEHSLLVFNDTKVVEARLLFQKSSGGVIELFCLEPDSRYPTIPDALQQEGKVYWECLVGGASKWKHGQVLEKKISIDSHEILLYASMVEKRTGSFLIEFNWEPSSLSFAEVLHHAGAIPLPPYIKRKAEQSDNERYQTIYAHFEGSVAAPTAGLHFTNRVFEALKQKGINREFVTLHVGAGTFKPVKSETMAEHDMHAEFIDVSIETLEHLKSQMPNPIIAVGTTSMRTLETLYWLGVKWANGETGTTNLTQWEAYEYQTRELSAVESLNVLITEMKKTGQERLIARTQIIIAPGYKIRMANGLVTNFHQPQSTLLLLVAALIGDSWKNIYQYALEKDFRFLSYGDGCLLWK